jgi:hypothetical protein
MADAIDNAQPDLAPRLLVVSTPDTRTPQKESRPVTSLATVFGKFAEMQHLVGDQVVALEESVEQQGRQLAEVAEQLPDMKERINWLIATFYDEEGKGVALRERLTRQEANLAAVTEAVRSLCEAQVQWKHTLDQLLEILGRAQSLAVPAAPRLPELA